VRHHAGTEACTYERVFTLPHVNHCIFRACEVVVKAAAASASAMVRISASSSLTGTVDATSRHRHFQPG
jgi:hypothetical protein